MMLEIIEYKLQHHECDEMLETAWSTMWNVTDETPANCQRFLHGRGMQLFLKCLEVTRLNKLLITITKYIPCDSIIHHYSIIAIIILQ